MKRWTATLLCVACLGLSPARAESSYVGYAFALDDGAALYEEHHRQHLEDGRVILETEYRAPDGEPFASRTVRFAQPVTAPEYRLTDGRFDYEEGAEALAEGYRIYLREDQELEESLIRPDKRPLVIDAGFDRLIVGRWEQLKAGETIRFEFVSTARLSKIDFRLRRVAQEETPYGPSSTFELKVGNPFVRLFLDPIRVSYLDRDKTLYAYEGISNLRDPEGGNYMVRIEFPPEERSGTQVRRLAVTKGAADDAR